MRCTAHVCSDIYICCISGTHKIAPMGKYIAILSTTIETCLRTASNLDRLTHCSHAREGA
jgi:RAB protein geranylgeranyltransferase component A